eukprot:14012268-Alexandrium_andersonii.AAC.1
MLWRVRMMLLRDGGLAVATTQQEPIAVNRPCAMCLMLLPLVLDSRVPLLGRLTATPRASANPNAMRA